MFLAKNRQIFGRFFVWLHISAYDQKFDGYFFAFSEKRQPRLNLFAFDRDWQQQDVAVIYISSHGSQSRADEIFWDIEPDHLNESIVCHDSRTQGVPDLLDKELRYLIAKLAKKCEHIAVFIDACHSAHITRYPNESDESVRLSPIDMNQYSPDSFVYW